MSEGTLLPRHGAKFMFGLVQQEVVDRSAGPRVGVYGAPAAVVRTALGSSRLFTDILLSNYLMHSAFQP